MTIYVKGRTTAAGTEYWNKDLKRTELFAPGTEPENVQTDGMVGKYSLSGKVADDEKNPPIETDPLDGMDAEQLREYAEENGIEVPGTMKKVETIRQHIVEELNAAADAQ